MQTALWPPIDSIRDALGLTDDQAPYATGPAGASVEPDAGASLPPPLQELARRRRALAALAQQPLGREGQLLSLTVAGRTHGVLLDRPEPDGAGWRAWLASAETDWAGPFDVLLEPGDEPFEPAFGLIQAWNAVHIPAIAGWRPQLAGSLSAARLAAIRSVAQESTGGAPAGIRPAPGRIALRDSAAGWPVLTGTPLAADDPRLTYQAAYREVAARLRSALEPAREAPPVRSLSVPAPWQRLVAWFGADRLVRPAFAALLALVALQAMWPWVPTDDEVRFRGAPAALPQPDAPVVRVHLQATATAEQLARLMRATGARSAAVGASAGVWALQVPDADAARRQLAAAAIVESVEAP